jgi:hypothetical protein
VGAGREDAVAVRIAVGTGKGDAVAEDIALEGVIAGKEGGTGAQDIARQTAVRRIAEQMGFIFPPSIQELYSYWG